jgi:hypothetical protein
MGLRKALPETVLSGAAIVLLSALAILRPHAARAADATWNGPGAEWTNAANWLPAVVPDGTATFTNKNPTSITISNSTSINTIDFTAATTTYSFAVSNSASTRLALSRVCLCL